MYLPLNIFLTYRTALAYMKRLKTYLRNFMKEVPYSLMKYLLYLLIVYFFFILF